MAAAAEENTSEAPAKIAPIVPVDPAAFAPDYSNVNYDFTEQYAQDRAAFKLVPDAAQIGISVSDEKGASGVLLNASSEEGNTVDYYLNAMVAGNRIDITATEGAISKVSSSVSGDIEINDGAASFVPAVLTAMDPVDEIVIVTMEDGTEYNIHTVDEMMATMIVTDVNVADENAGVYDFAIDKFLYRVNTKGEIVYSALSDHRMRQFQHVVSEVGDGSGFYDHCK